METVTVVLNVRTEDGDAFEAGFRAHELPVWQDLRARGLLERATLNRLDISSPTHASQNQPHPTPPRLGQPQEWFSRIQQATRYARPRWPSSWPRRSPRATHRSLRMAQRPSHWQSTLA